MLEFERNFADFVGYNFNRFRKFATVIRENLLLGLNMAEPWEGKTPGGSTLMGFQVFKKHWISEKKIEECNTNEQNYWVHFEFQWQPDDKPDLVNLFIHFETNPYYPESKLIREYLDAYKAFEPLRDKFTVELHNRMKKPILMTDWKSQRYMLRKAICQMPSNAPINEVLQWCKAQYSIASPIIDETLACVLTA